MATDASLEKTDINECFTYIEFEKNEVFGEIVPNGLSFVQSGEVQAALAIVTRIITDVVGSEAMFGYLGSLFHPSIDVVNTLAVLSDVVANKFYITVQHDGDMERAYIQCLHVPSLSFPWLDRSMIIILNLKYIMSSKTNQYLQIYFLVCKILHQIGNAMAPGLLQLVPGFDPRPGAVSPPQKVGTVMVRCRASADCGSAVEEIAYGGRIHTYNNSAKPYAKSLEIILRRNLDLAPGPGNYATYRISDTYVETKTADLLAYARTPTVAFPGIQIPPEARTVQLEAHLAGTRELAESWQRSASTRKRSAMSSNTLNTPHQKMKERRMRSTSTLWSSDWLTATHRSAAFSRGFAYKCRQELIDFCCD